MMNGAKETKGKGRGQRRSEEEVIVVDDDDAQEEEEELTSHTTAAREAITGTYLSIDLHTYLPTYLPTFCVLPIHRLTPLSLIYIYIYLPTYLSIYPSPGLLAALVKRGTTNLIVMGENGGVYAIEAIREILTR